MSTQGIVAVGTLAEWRGIYNDSDSYPSSLGKKVREILISENEEGKALKEIAANILAFDNWRNFESGGICPYCGQIATRPHSMSSDLVMSGGGSDGEFPDADCLRHEHDPIGDLEENQITHEGLEDDSDIDWIYVINVKSRLIHVIDNRDTYGRNLHVGDIALRGTEPNYEHLECAADFSRCDHKAIAHFDEIDPDGPQSRLSTKQYLGVEPVAEMHDTVAVIIKGERYGWDGQAFTESGIQSSNPKPKLMTRDPNVLHAELEFNGVKKWIPVGSVRGDQKKPLSGIAWVFPATKVMPEFAVVGR
jgi:hypothetical protein